MNPRVERRIHGTNVRLREALGVPDMRRRWAVPPVTIQRTSEAIGHSVRGKTVSTNAPNCLGWVLQQPGRSCAWNVDSECYKHE